MIYARNLPLWERALRILAGCNLIAWCWLAAPFELVAIVVIAAGVGLTVTSFFGSCPTCALTGHRPVGS